MKTFLKLRLFSFTVVALAFIASKTSATLVPYRTGVSADVQTNYSVDGSGFLTAGTLVNTTPQTLLYGPNSRSVNAAPNTQVTFSGGSNGFLTECILSGDQQVAAGFDADYGAFGVNLQEDWSEPYSGFSGRSSEL